MSKLLKSKILLGVMIFAVMFVGFAVVKTASAETCDLGTVTLKQGMSGTAVTCLQTKLAVTPMTGYFGSITKAKVIAFQSANQLVADGVVGNLTKAALGMVTTTTTTTTVGSTTLSGGAGSIDLTSTTSNVESKVKEGGDNTKVMAFKLEAVDSDIAVTNLKLVFAQTGDADSSEKLSNYVDSVDVYMGSTKVGSADASDFSRESSDTPDTYSKSIALSNAIVDENAKATFYVEVTAVSSIDSDALSNGTDPAEWTVGATDIRYQDATGVIMSGNDSLPTKADVISGGSATAMKTFQLEDITTDDSLDVKSSSTNPDDATITVKTSSSTEDVSALAFKLDAGDDSADVTVTDMKITVGVTNFDATGNGTVDASDDIDVSAAGQWADRIISELNVKVDGKTYTGDLDANVTTAQDVTDGAGTVTYTVEFDNDVVISAGETPTVEVLLTFNEQSDSDYNEGVVVTTTLANATDVSAETDEDSLTVGGSGKTGADLTLSLAEATISNYSWSINSTGSIVDFFFTVAAEGDDFDVVAANILDSVAGTATVTNGAGTDFETSDYGILSKYSGDSVSAIAGNTGYTVAEGDTTTFRVRYSLTGASNGMWKEITITSIGGINVPENKQTSPTATISYN
jgi:peptidoglycan hydrolase-like protein with peptidoglycan-binding domain